MTAATTKSWSTKSNVRRVVAKEHGANAVEGKHFEIITKSDGTFTYRLIEQKPAAKKNGNSKAKAAPLNLSAEALSAAASINSKKLDKELNQKEEKKAAAKVAKIADQIEKAPSKVKEIVRKSTVEKPTHRVWEIADEMFEEDPETRRSVVIAECVREGIAFYTARTQYQHWFSARQARAAEAAAKKAAKKAAR